MKKLLLLTLAILTLTSEGYSQNSPTKKNGWETDNLRGKVKSYTQSSYDSAERFGEIQKTLSSKETYKYDDKSNLIEDNSYYSDSSLNCKWTYKYDDKDNRIEANGYSANGSFNGKYINKYDDKGNQIEENYYKADGSLDSKETYKYEFDGKGNWIKRITFKNQIPKSIYEREYEYYE